MKFENNIEYDFSDVLLLPKRSTIASRKDAVIDREFNFYHSKRTWKGIPIIAANMDTTGTFEMAKALSKHKIITALHKFYSVEDLSIFFSEFNDPDYIAYTMGIKDEDFSKFKELINRGLEKNFNFINLDVPNAYLERYVEKLNLLRQLCPNHTIIAGNVVTNEMTTELILEGADIVKVGIGSGSPCITRRKAGVGRPQFSAIVACSDAAHQVSNGNGCGRIISDGGVVEPGDIAKAFSGGADFVMMGSMFAGYDQSGGNLIEKNGKKFKEFYGMSSEKAQEKHYKGMAKYKASEGRYLLIPYKGNVEILIQDLLGSLRSTATYIGAKKLKEFPKRATFVVVNNQLNRSLVSYDVENKNQIEEKLNQLEIFMKEIYENLKK